MDRTSLYEWKRRFQLEGLASLKDWPPIHKSHPQTTPVEVSDRILGLTLNHLAYGCNRIEAMLILEGKRVSATTIQKILNDHNFGTRYDRWLALESRKAETPIELSAEQVAFIEKLNPAFRERHVESDIPGELLCQDTLFVGNLKGIGKGLCPCLRRHLRLLRLWLPARLQAARGGSRCGAQRRAAAAVL